MSPINYVGAIILGNVPLIIAFAAYAFRIDRLLTKFLVEHEMLMGWYCKEHGIDPDKLPTRIRR